MERSSEAHEQYLDRQQAQYAFKAVQTPVCTPATRRARKLEGSRLQIKKANLIDAIKDCIPQGEWGNIPF